MMDKGDFPWPLLITWLPFLGVLVTNNCAATVIDSLRYHRRGSVNWFCPAMYIYFMDAL